LRRLVRYRQGLASEKKAINLRILALLREERIPNGSGRTAWTKAWFAWLTTVRLGEQSRWVLEQELQRLARTTQEIEGVELRMEQATRNDPIIAKLREEPGLGVVTAVTLRAVIGRFDRFRSGKQLARYCGVTPRNASSGKRQADAGLIETGHDVLRPLLIQLAKRLPRHEPRWRQLSDRLRIRKSANVVSAAIANRWLRRLYHELKTTAIQTP
jgi:transposase